MEIRILSGATRNRNLLFSATVVSRLRLQRYAKFWNLQIFWQKKKEKVINRFMNPVQNSQKTFP